MDTTPAADDEHGPGLPRDSAVAPDDEKRLSWAERDPRHEPREEHQTKLAADKWIEIERGLLGQAETRIRDFEFRLSREWEALRHLHEESLRSLRLQQEVVSNEYAGVIDEGRRAIKDLQMRIWVHDTEFSGRLAEAANGFRQAAQLLGEQTAATPRAESLSAPLPRATPEMSAAA